MTKNLDTIDGDATLVRKGIIASHCPKAVAVRLPVNLLKI